MLIKCPVNPGDVDSLLALYAQAWWTKDRSRDEVAAMLLASDLTACVMDDHGTMVGFVRALTDWRYKAVVMDLIVDEEHRGQAIGKLPAKASSETREWLKSRTSNSTVTLTWSPITKKLDSVSRQIRASCDSHVPDPPQSPKLFSCSWTARPKRSAAPSDHMVK